MRAVITGAPGAGKSTLLTALADAGLIVCPEAARGILQAPGGMALRADDPQGFAAAMLSSDLESWNAPPCGRVIHDRGFPDIVGFLDLEGLAIPDELDRACRELRYDGPIFRAPPWRAIYKPDSERTQDWSGAKASDAAVCSAWRRYGYALIDLPLAPVADRRRCVLDLLATASAKVRVG